MKNFKSLVCLILVLLMLVPVAVACKKDNGENTDGEGSGNVSDVSDVDESESDKNRDCVIFLTEYHAIFFIKQPSGRSIRKCIQYGLPHRQGKGRMPRDQHGMLSVGKKQLTGQ